MNMQTHTARLLSAVRSKAPLIHNITNFVVMNSSANILLAVGASPVMAHCQDEVAEMTSMADALVLNIGTLDQNWVKSMITAARTANAKGIPIVLDPVGAGATKLRTQAVQQIMDQAQISVLRGNASEIFSMASSDVQTKGVDASMGINEDVVAAAKQIALEKHCIIAISGKEDCITDGQHTFRIANGQPLMARITGTGCGLTAVCGAFCSVADGELLPATAAAFGYYGLCGDLAFQVSDKPGSFAAAFIDALYASGPKEIDTLLRISTC